MLAHSTALRRMSRSRQLPRISDVAYLWWHVVQGVERRVDVGHETLGGERREETLRVCAEVWWDLRALPDSDLLITHRQHAPFAFDPEEDERHGRSSAGPG